MAAGKPPPLDAVPHRKGFVVEPRLARHAAALLLTGVIASACLAAPALASGPDALAGPSGPPGGHLKLTVARGKGLRDAPRRHARHRAHAAAVTTDPGALILYDSTGAYAWLGQAYATMVANLA